VASVECPPASAPEAADPRPSLSWGLRWGGVDFTNERRQPSCGEAGGRICSSHPPLAECFDHVLVINEAHLRRVLRKYFAYYHESRPHQSLEGNAPRPREIEPSSQGGSWPSPRSVVSISDTDALPEVRPASSLWIYTPRPVAQLSDQRSGRKACRRIRIAGWFSHPSAHRWPVFGDGFGPR
jgi:hypothetical protein